MMSQCDRHIAREFTLKDMGKQDRSKTKRANPRKYCILRMLHLVESHITKSVYVCIMNIV